MKAKNAQQISDVKKKNYNEHIKGIYRVRIDKH